MRSSKIADSGILFRQHAAPERDTGIFAPYPGNRARTMVEGLFGKLAVSAFSVVFVVVGLYAMHRGRNERARSERIAETETATIRDLQPGTAEVKGTARPANDASVVASPITGEEAVATYVEMEEWETGGEGGGNWETKHEERTAVPMVVDDGTGEVRVELPTDGELNVEQTRWKVGSGDEPPEPVEQYLEGADGIAEASRYEVGALSVGERRRYSEGVIEPGEGVYVLGVAREAESDWGERNYVIDDTTASGDFILSDKSEEELIREGKRSGLVYLGFGAVLVVAGVLGTVIPWVGA